MTEAELLISIHACVLKYARQTSNPNPYAVLGVIEHYKSQYINISDEIFAKLSTKDS
jgi:hypothetical protein